jgi:hypothetical protein
VASGFVKLNYKSGPEVARFATDADQRLRALNALNAHKTNLLRQVIEAEQDPVLQPYLQRVDATPRSTAREPLSHFDEPAIIRAMQDFVRRTEWQADEQQRLNLAFETLADPGNSVVPSDDSDEIREIWREILARPADGVLARKATAGQGANLARAGQQSFNDCTVFAIAHASSRPYGEVAARAANIISAGEWRPEEIRANPQQVMEREGLYGGEVIFVVEAFGKVQVIPPQEFESSVAAGRAVMLNIIPSGGEGGHQIVLSRTFKHENQTWFEAIDSNQGPLRRLFLSQNELASLAQEPGITFTPDTQPVDLSPNR